MTPWLKRRPRAIGLGDSIGDYYKGQLQAKLNGLSAQGQAQLNSYGISTDTTTTNGASAAVSLASNGFDPNSIADQQKVVDMVAGGVALIGFPVGTALAGAVEALYQVGQAAACPTIKFFADLGLGSVPPECGGAPCTSSGTWTPATVLAASQLPPMPPGSFASVVIPALAVIGAGGLNCKPSPPPDVVIDSVVDMWNASHAGPAVDYFVPPINLNYVPLIPFWQSGDSQIVDYAFQPLSATPWAGNIQNAQSAVPPDPAASGFAFGADRSDMRTVSVNIGAPIAITKHTKHINFHLGPSGGGITATAAPSSGGITATQVVLGTTAAALIGTGIYAWVKKKAYSQVWDQIWKGATKPFKGRR